MRAIERKNHPYSLGLYVFTLLCAALYSGTVLRSQVTPSSGNNYILQRTVLVSGKTTGSQVQGMSASDLRQSVTYYDGLGRPVQQTGIQAAPDGRDIITPIAYDAYGRQDKSYLPYAASGTSGSYRTTAVADQMSFYATSPATSIPVIAVPYSQTVYESSPLDRPLEQGFAGSTSTWGVGGTHTVKQSYQVNAANEVRVWTVQSNSGQNYGATGTSYYGAGQLYKNVTTDENGNQVLEYTDKDGRVVCKKVQDGLSGTTPTYVSTQYIYDDFGNLSYVLPPNAESTSSFTENDDVFNKSIYGYHYDGRRRLIEKKVPGKWWSYTVYDVLDRVRLTQEPEQMGAGYWIFTKYDAIGRVTMTGTYASTSARFTLQAQLDADASTPLYEVRTSTTPTGYTSQSFPLSTSATHTVVYYDDYSFLSLSGVNTYPTLVGAPAGTAGESLQTNGLVTGTRTLELGGTKLRLEVRYYDKYGRVSKTSTEHVVNGVDVTTNSYNFPGELMSSVRKHYANNNTTAASPSLTITTTNAYDHWGRLSTVQKQVNSGTLTTVSTNTYNPVGQLQTKVLGKDGTVTAGLQTVDYVYNSRGWMTETKSTLFSEKLWYEQSYNGSTAQWNGNISAQQWGWGTSGSYANNYVYGYDKLSRLTSAASNEGYNETGITYDKTGNILTLTRPKISTTPITYTYSGTQLAFTTGGYARTYSYNGNGSMTTDGQVNVAYNELNLPKAVTSVSGSTVNSQYVYDASGTKLKKVTATETRYYVDGIEYYTNSATTTPTIDIVGMEEGVIRNSSGTYTYEYFLKDHLGNTRVAFNKNSSNVATQLQRYDYYAFGKEILRSSSTTNKYLYNGKELQAETGQYDYGARFYDPNIARWMVVDPLADEENEMWSPFNYVKNNPVLRIDPDGMQDTIIDSRRILPTVTVSFHPPDVKPYTGFLGWLRYQWTGGYVNGYHYNRQGVEDHGGRRLNMLVTDPPVGDNLESLLNGLKNLKNITKSLETLRKSISVQKQARHILGTAEKGKSYLNSLEDAQKVLDAVHSGEATLLGTSKAGHQVYEYKEVTGTNVNLGNGIINQPTNVYLIKGTSSPSVVPTTPNWKP